MNSDFRSLTLRVSDMPRGISPDANRLESEGVMEQTKYFDHYRIATRRDGTPREVRRSGASIQYKAIDERTGEPVMLQLLALSTLNEAKHDQFEEHARAAQQLDHVNVARVLDVLRDREHIGIVSEYVGGETTEEWLVNNGPMPADAVLRIGLQ